MPSSAAHNGFKFQFSISIILSSSFFPTTTMDRSRDQVWISMSVQLRALEVPRGPPFSRCPWCHCDIDGEEDVVIFNVHDFRTPRHLDDGCSGDYHRECFLPKFHRQLSYFRGRGIHVTTEWECLLETLLRAAVLNEEMSLYFDGPHYRLIRGTVLRHWGHVYGLPRRKWDTTSHSGCLLISILVSVL